MEQIKTKVVVTNKITTKVKLADKTSVSTAGAIIGATCAELNDITSGLTEAQRQLIQLAGVLPTGKTSSQLTGDDGDTKRGRALLTTFFKLSCNNGFNNDDRFTDSVGGQDYDGTGGSLVNYVLDWATRLAWLRTRISGGATWDNAVPFAIGSTNLGLSGWFMPNKNEVNSVRNDEAGNGNLNFSPLNISGLMWTNMAINATLAKAFDSNNGNHTNRSRTQAAQVFICRFFTLSELGL